VKLLFTSLLGVLPLATAVAAPPISFGKTGTGLFLLTDDNRLSSVCDTLATAPSPPVSITGLVDNDVLVAIDVRPRTQQLYGLARNSVTGTFQFYHLSPVTGLATAVGPANALADSSGNPLSTSASRFDFDFSPVADRARVVTSSGLNFRINPTTGACVDGNAGAPGTNPDSAINGATTTVDGVAYTNNVPGTAATTLYTLDSTSDAIYLQNPPNNGTQVSPVFLTLSGIGVNFTATLGFDVAPGVDAAASGTAYAALSGIGIGGLYRIDLSSGAATPLGVPAGFNIRSLAVRTQIPVAIGLDTAGANLIRFRLDSPGTTNSVAVSGLTGGETLVGIDIRPATGQIYGLGIHAAANTGSLYLIDPQGGSATVVGTPGQIAFTNGGGAPIDLPDMLSSGYGVNFSPTADRLRVTCGTGLNFRVNPNTGAPIDGDAVAIGVNTDAAINGGNVATTAYTNAYAQTLVATQYTLDATANRLRIQTPPNNGTQTAGVPVTVNGAPLDFATTAGFDITAEGGGTLVSNTPAKGHGWAALMVGGVTSLYQIDLASGIATPRGQIGSGAALAGLTVAAEDGAGFAPLGWTSITNTTYRIETTASLDSWRFHPGNVMANGAFTTAPVPIYDGEPRRFWRVIAP
jgi:hypothetical protein